MTNYAVYPLRLHSSCARRCRPVAAAEIRRVPKTDRVINWLRITANVLNHRFYDGPVRVNNFIAVTRELLLNELLHDTRSYYRNNRFHGFLIVYYSICCDKIVILNGWNH